MTVPILKRWRDASAYLDMLAQTVITDILPLLNTSGGAPHAIARGVFSYIDYLGALHVGAGDNTPCDRGTGLPQVGYRFRTYLIEVMSLTDINYAKQAETIYHMYRNGPVHEFDPKVLKNSLDQRLDWFVYRGQRQDSCEYKDGIISVRHLAPVLAPDDPHKFYLPASTICLVQDLLTSLEYFKRGVIPKAQRTNATHRISRWNSTARKLNDPVTCEFTV